MSGSAVMYDIDKIFAAGGAKDYNLDWEDASNRAYTIDISGPEAVVEKMPNMFWSRVFLNAVVLPDGKIVILGGQTKVKSFSDEYAVLEVEMFDPVTKTYSAFRERLTTPRTYHSVGLLLKDGRVLSGGGGLCGAGCDYFTTWVRTTCPVI